MPKSRHRPVPSLQKVPGIYFNMLFMQFWWKERGRNREYVSSSLGQRESKVWDSHGFPGEVHVPSSKHGCPPAILALVIHAHVESGLQASPLTTGFEHKAGRISRTHLNAEFQDKLRLPAPSTPFPMSTSPGWNHCYSITAWTDNHYGPHTCCRGLLLASISPKWLLICSSHMTSGTRANPAALVFESQTWLCSPRLVTGSRITPTSCSFSFSSGVEVLAARECKEEKHKWLKPNTTVVISLVQNIVQKQT